MDLKLALTSENGMNMDQNSVHYHQVLYLKDREKYLVLQLVGVAFIAVAIFAPTVPAVVLALIGLLIWIDGLRGFHPPK